MKKNKIILRFFISFLKKNDVLTEFITNFKNGKGYRNFHCNFLEINEINEFLIYHIRTRKHICLIENAFRWEEMKWAELSRKWVRMCQRFNLY